MPRLILPRAAGARQGNVIKYKYDDGDPPSLPAATIGFPGRNIVKLAILK